MTAPPRNTSRSGSATFAKLLIAAAFPLVALGNALLILLLPWTAEVMYALPGFPDDPLGLAGSDREELAETGIRAIWPVGPGSELLVDATLPDGSEAFTEKEITHMDDVRELVRITLGLWLLALVAGAASALTLVRRGGQLLTEAIRLGALVTLAAMALLLLVSAVAFEPFFDAFHGIFFEGDSWKFKDFYTLRRIYPDAFWSIATVMMALLVLAQALVAVWMTRESRIQS